MPSEKEELKPCKTCIFWETADGLTWENKRWGVCHRFPSTRTKSDDDYCGEWRVA